MSDDVKISPKELERRLPDFKEELDYLKSKNFTDFEDKLSEATNKAMDTLCDMIDNGTLALDPEQAINAVKVLATARKDLMESRRKLLETVIRGEVMMKALEPPSGKKELSPLQEYMINHPTNDNGNNSIFQQVDRNNQLEEN